MSQTTHPPISVVIRTFNVASTLPKLLAALPLGAEDELVFVDSGSTDNIRDLISARPHHWVDVSHRPYTPGFSLNAGFERAKNPLVLVISAHVIPLVPDLLATYRAVSLAHPDAAAIAGAIHWFRIDYRPHAPTCAISAEEIRRGRVLSVGNPNCLYHRDRWQELPFSDTVRYVDDHQWLISAAEKGWGLAICPRAAVHYHGHRDTFRNLYLKGYKTIGESAHQTPPTTNIINIAKLSAKLVFSCATGERSPLKAAKFLAYATGMWIGTRQHHRQAGSAAPRS